MHVLAHAREGTTRPPPRGVRIRRNARQKRLAALLLTMVCRALGALLAVVIGGKGAHAQFNLGGGVLSPTCDFASFQSRSEQVDIACCQGKGSNVCTTGTPSQCDLECALVYLSFFEDCENLIRALGSAPTPTVVHVGSSGVNPARIPIDDMASCDADPAVPANRQDPGWSDTFSVHLQQKRRGQNLVVTRTDTDGGWGQDLEITCTANGPLPGLVQLADQCEAIPVTEAIDMIEDLLGHCDTVQLDCSGPSGCRGGPPVQCAQAPGAASGVTTLAEVITIGEEVSYDGLCNQDVDGGGWTYVAEPGLSTVDPDDVFAEELHGYHVRGYPRLQFPRYGMNCDKVKSCVCVRCRNSSMTSRVCGSTKCWFAAPAQHGAIAGGTLEISGVSTAYPRFLWESQWAPRNSATTTESVVCRRASQYIGNSTLTLSGLIF